MPSFGHVPITNQTPGDRSARVILEVAAGTPLTSQPTLPEYVRPTASRRAPSLLLESAGPEQESADPNRVNGDSDEDNLRDAALASFGSAAASLGKPGIL